MIHLKVQYDAHTRTFKLVDRGFGTLLEDCGLYDLVIPFTFQEAEEQDSFISIETTMAHA